MNWVRPTATQARYLWPLAVTASCFLLVSNVLASPESTPTPKVTATANAKQAANPTPRGIARAPRLAPTGEPIYASRLVTTSSALARSRPGVTVWSGWLVGLDGNPVRGQYARLPDGRLVDMSFEIQQQYNAQHGIQRPRKSKAELEAYRRRLEQDWDKEVARREKGDDKITPEQRRLWQRMNRPWGTPWRSFSAPDEHGYPNN